MKRSLFLKLAGSFALVLSMASRLRSVNTTPNFIFILIDDMGWTGLSVPMDKDISESKSDLYQTPMIAQLASQGMRFSNAYAPAPMCTPSRASFLTGKSPAQLHMTTPGPVRKAFSWQKVAPPGHVTDLPVKEVTIADILKNKGYATAHFGKWHLHGEGPGKYGFDSHDGETGYLQLSHYALHEPHKCLKKTAQSFSSVSAGERHSNREYAAMTKDLDTGVGMILDAVKSLGLSKDSYVVLMSDNGAGGRKRQPENAPLSGGKAQLYEGGIRVPLIISGPNVKPGTFCSVNVVGYDLFPTFCELAGIKEGLPKGIEGTSILPCLKEKPESFKRDKDYLVFHFPHYGMGPSQVPQSAIIQDNWKLIKNHETGELYLYDLKKDIGKKNNLAKKSPDKASSLYSLMNNHLKSIKAGFPTNNLNYEPEASRPNRGKNKKRRSRK